MPFLKEIFIERKDFQEEASRKFLGLTLGREVRLKSGYTIKAEKVVKNVEGAVEEILCTYDPKSLSGSDTPEAKRKVKGTQHWVSAKHALPAEVRLYAPLFKVETPDQSQENFLNFIKEDSLKVVQGFLEPDAATANIGLHLQFFRLGYFIVDKDSTPQKLIFNRITPLREFW